MYIAKKKLEQCKKEDIIRLAHFLNITTAGRELENVIIEVLMKINPLLPSRMYW